MAREVAERGTVLLRNEGALPLDSSKLRTLAVIGPEAEVSKGGGGSSAVNGFPAASPLEAITARAGPGTEVRYEPGDDSAAAVTAARGADAAIVFSADSATEGVDKADLTTNRDALIEEVAAVNPSTVVVLETGGPVLTPWRERVAAVLEAWYPGQEAGPALAGVLFGDTDPGGRLPATFSRSEADVPTTGVPEQAPSGLLRAGPRSPQLFPVRRGRVRLIAVADRRLLRDRRASRCHLRLAFGRF